MLFGKEKKRRAGWIMNCMNSKREKRMRMQCIIYESKQKGANGEWAIEWRINK